MDLDVRAASPDDGADALLYASAPVYYDAFAGGEARARRLLRSIHARPGHTASWEVCRVAVHRGEVIAVTATFPVADAERLARRFMLLSFARVAPWRWPHLVRHLNAASRVSPSPPAGSWYIDALAVAEPARRHGVARALLRDAEAVARERGATGVALDTGLENAAARALYERCGYEERDVRRVRDPRDAARIGGSGFVGYYKRLDEPTGR